jgi:hypothetical protein
VGDFIRRKGDRLCSLYLRNINNLRVSSEYGPMFKLFFELVGNPGVVVVVVYLKMCG